MPRARIAFEIFIQLLIFYSIGVHFIEEEYSAAERGRGFFLWSERVVVAIFTAEYFARWVESGRLRYPFRLVAVIDLLAILPFYVGFFVDLRALRLVRTLRVLRLLKLHRHNRALTNLTNAFSRVRYEFGIIAFAVIFTVWTSAVVLYELEREAQPAEFGRLTDALWFVLTTITTVGYGDKVPATGAGKLVAAITMLCGLAIFGTFISLIGSAFLDEIRRVARHGREVHAPGPLAAMTAADFDPRLVLAAVEAGAFAEADLAGQEAARLLAEACRRLLNQGADPPAP